MHWKVAVPPGVTGESDTGSDNSHKGSGHSYECIVTARDLNATGQVHGALSAPSGDQGVQGLDVPVREITPG